MKIVIATPLYPPDIGGPAEYAYNLEREFQKLGHEVAVTKFTDIRYWPSGWRHLLYFLKLLSAMRRCDWCLALDTFSVGLPAVVAGRLLGKKIIIRIGGDFLWEGYVERTADLALLRDFYRTRSNRLNWKEKLIFKFTRWTVRHCYKLVFSTDWQRDIWRNPYGLVLERIAIIENYYGPKLLSNQPKTKNFLCAGRRLKLKNVEKLKEIDAQFEIGQWSPQVLAEKIKNCYALIVPSLSDISPNIVLQAVQYNKPFILTKETGLVGRLEKVALFVDTLNVKEIENKIIWLADEKNYQTTKEKIEQFAFSHTWLEIAGEFLALSEEI